MTHKKKHLLNAPEDHDTTGLVPGQLLEGGGDRIVSSGVFSTDVADAIALKHQQNTDQYLDQGGPNQVTAAEIRSHLDTFRLKNVVAITAAGSYTVGANDDVIIYTSATGLLSLTLPDPTTETGREITVIATADNNALPANKPRIAVSSAGGATVGYGLTYNLAAPGSATFVSNGTLWAVKNSTFGYIEKQSTYQTIDSTVSPYTPVGYEEVITVSGTNPVTVDLSSAPKDATAKYLIINESTATAQVSDATSLVDGRSTVYLAPQEAVLVQFGFNASTWRILSRLVRQQSRVSIYTATATLAVTDHTVFANSTTAVTLTLPTPQFAGHEVRIKNINTGAVTVSGGANNIDGAATFSLPNQYDAASFVWNGTEWSVF